jgi:choline kinase
LEHVILGAHQAGVDEFVIVVGYRSDMIRRWFGRRWFPGISVTWVENPEFHKQNGVSALKARYELEENFLLLMADHVFEPRTARTLIEQPLAPGEVILAVDPKIDRVFDLDDATKVRREGDRIVDIGKEIAHYDALDTGMFLCTPALFDRLESSSRDGNCSLSDGMRELAHERLLGAMEIGAAEWQDVDTPEALTHAEAAFHPYLHGGALPETLAA